MPTHTVFYSWQSDLPNPTNRGFIQDALERAAKEIRKDEEIGIDPSIDRDTQGVPGSPNIVATIFEKIGRADVFVADVSFITPPGYGGRPMPNPNVLIELGYAANRHGWNRILCVFNAATGRVEDLPFDIRQHTITGYSLTEGQEKADVRKTLVAQLRDKIRLILTTPDAAAVQARAEFDAGLSRYLISLLLFGGESDLRDSGQPFAEMLSQFQIAASGFRHLAADRMAQELGRGEELIRLADQLDELAHMEQHFEAVEQFESLLKEMMGTVTDMKTRWLDPLPAHPDVPAEARAELTRLARQLASLTQRAEKLSEGRIGELQIHAGTVGEELFRLSFLKLDRLRPGVADELREIGRELHRVWAVDPYSAEQMDEIVEVVRRENTKLAELVRSLPEVR